MTPTELEIDSPLDPSRKQRETTCLAIAAGLHALLLLWNPILLKTDWQPAHELVQIDLVEAPAPGGPPSEVPKKMSLLATIKDMLVKPSVDEIAHVAPQMPTVPQVAAPPKLQDRSMTHPLATAFTPKSQMDDLATASNPNQINTAPHPVANLPAAGPTITSKSFSGIRAKDLPFNVNENLAANTAAVPIAVGNSSMKAAASYTGPQLSEKGHHTAITPTLHDVGGSPADMPSLGAGASESIPLAGTGRAGTAPTGAPTGQVLQNRSGSSGGLVNRVLSGGSRVGSGIEGIPAAARQLDEESVNAAANQKARRNPKSGDITGPLSNRAIVHKVIPEYPAWAEEQGIVGSVQIYFTVDAAGNVRSNLQIRKTTGNVQLDQLALEALKQWKFAASDAEGEWGIITFNFSLSS